jgi:hypothetical protein
MEYYRFDMEFQNADKRSKSLPLANLYDLHSVFELNHLLNNLDKKSFKKLLDRLVGDIDMEGFKWWGMGWKRCSTTNPDSILFSRPIDIVNVNKYKDELDELDEPAW